MFSALYENHCGKTVETNVMSYGRPTLTDVTDYGPSVQNLLRSTGIWRHYNYSVISYTIMGRNIGLCKLQRRTTSHLVHTHEFTEPRIEGKYRSIAYWKTGTLQFAYIQLLYRIMLFLWQQDRQSLKTLHWSMELGQFAMQLYCT